VHPASVVKQKFPNARTKEPLTGLVCLRKEAIKVHNNYQKCAVFRHEDFAMAENVVLRWVEVHQEGQPFEVVSPTLQPSSARELPYELRRATGQDFNCIRDEGFEVDDDNDPARENVPDDANHGVVFLSDGQELTKDGLCRRKKDGVKELLGRLTPSMKGNQAFTAPCSLVSQAAPSHWDV
jgi:hypothetical protein